MNSIEKDFLKVIRNRQSFLVEGENNEDITLATELSGKVERFIHWIEFEECPFEAEEDDGKEFWGEKYVDDSKHHTLSELWEYFIQIDK